MNYIFHPEAKKEVLVSIEYYEEKANGLGIDFSIEVYSTIQKIIEFPKAWSTLDIDIHRCLLKRFPFGIIYSVYKKQIYILAVMNLHKEPDYWKNRI